MGLSLSHIMQARNQLKVVFTSTLTEEARVESGTLNENPEVASNYK